jgi:hypothetical protein
VEELRPRSLFGGAPLSGQCVLTLSSEPAGHRTQIIRCHAGPRCHEFRGERGDGSTQEAEAAGVIPDERCVMEVLGEDDPDEGRQYRGIVARMGPQAPSSPPACPACSG